MHIKKISLIPGEEIIHFFSGEEIISSYSNKVKIKLENYNKTITLPCTRRDSLLGKLRLTRRLFRLDKCNVLISNDQAIIIKNGIVYNYDLNNEVLSNTLQLEQCKNVLHQSIAKTPDGRIFFGEYGRNPERKPVNIYCSKNNGKSWEIIYSFKPGAIRHVHGCYYDPYEEKIWTLTGDYEKENKIMVSDQDFKEIEIIGDGSQRYRAVSIIFEKNEVHWVMDSPLEKSYQFTMNRKTRKVEQRNLFPGPVWYMKKLDDGYYLAGTTVEKGEGVLANYAGLFISKDLKSWNCLKKFEKDIFPMPYFKWGVLSFADGNQTSRAFAIHFEALKGVDGKSFIYSLNEK